MNIKTKKLLVALSVAILFTSVAHAQRVESSALENLQPIINCDDMPIKSYTTALKDPSEAKLKTKDADTVVFKRFAVGQIDSYYPIEINRKTYTWHEAFTVCSSIGDYKLGWRLPTKRELSLIFILRKSLSYTDSKVFEPLVTNEYWCATEYSDVEGWNINFFNGGASHVGKTAAYRVRCIKELPESTTKASPKKVKELPKASK